MASEERNALVGLAYVLQWHVDEFSVYRGVPTMQLHEAISKAHRIISELAKVVDCKEPERIMPIDKPYDDIILYAPYDNGMTESNSINEDEKRFIFDLANAAWNCREIAGKEEQ